MPAQQCKRFASKDFGLPIVACGFNCTANDPEQRGSLPRALRVARRHDLVGCRHRRRRTSYGSTDLLSAIARSHARASSKNRHAAQGRNTEATACYAPTTPRSASCSRSLKGTLAPWKKSSWRRCELLVHTEIEKQSYTRQ
jgi:hypothetical protein